MPIEISKKDFNKIVKNQNINITFSNKKGEGMKNKLTDLNNHLFEQLERLNDEELTSEQLENEIARTKAMTQVADSIINNAKVVLDASKFVADCGYTFKPEETLKLLGADYE